MDLTGGWVLPAAWGTLGLTIVVSAVLASRHRAALAVGIGAVSVLWVVAGAGANLAMLLDGTTYTGFAGGSAIPFVRDTWESLVVPHHHVFIGLLIAGEALAGVLVLFPGRLREAALGALVCFNATLVVFGWAFAIWAVPLVAALVLLLRAERLRSRRLQPSAGASSGHHRSPRNRVPSP
jgi:hypothetical protein